MLKFQTERQGEQQKALLEAQNEHAKELQNLQKKNDEALQADQTRQAEKLFEWQKTSDERRWVIEAEHSRQLLELQFQRDEAKEKGVTVFATKAEVYKALLEELEEIINKPVLREGDFSQLTFLSLRVAYVACPNVIERLREFAKVLRDSVTGPNDPSETEDDEQNKQITRAERRKILLEFSEVSQMIRQDLVEEKVETETIQSIIDHFSKAGEIANSTADRASASVALQQLAKTLADGEINPPVIALVDIPQTPAQMTEEQFIAACGQPGEREFYQSFFVQLRAERFEPLWTQKGFSVNKTLKFYPSIQTGNKNWNLIDYPVRTERRGAVEEALSAAGMDIKFEEKSSLRFDWNEMQKTTPEKFVGVVKAMLR